MGSVNNSRKLKILKKWRLGYFDNILFIYFCFCPFSTSFLHYFHFYLYRSSRPYLRQSRTLPIPSIHLSPSHLLVNKFDDLTPLSVCTTLSACCSSKFKFTVKRQRRRRRVYDKQKHWRRLKVYVSLSSSTFHNNHACQGWSSSYWCGDRCRVMKVNKLYKQLEVIKVCLVAILKVKVAIVFSIIHYLSCVNQFWGRAKPHTEATYINDAVKINKK